MNFHLAHLPERPERPRQHGLTMMMDKGLGLQEAGNFIDSSGHLTDLVKLGFGTSMVTPKLKEKIKLYQQSGLKVYLGGTLFEAFVVRKQFDDYRKLIESLGLEMAEVSDGSLVMPHDEKCKYIHTLSGQVTVVSEVGSKEEGLIIHPGKWITMMKKELEAGSWKVIAEARESGTVGIYHRDGKTHSILVDKIIAKIPSEKIIWEAPQKPQQVWFIKNMGANVNLGNIAPTDVVALETLRLGLRGDTFFEFLPPASGKKNK
jgi:phosphosulfolactate synthase